MTRTPLRIENLGDKGQARFAELCADAGLICNPATQDRAGSDFLVDFPQVASPTLPFDQRPAPLSAHFQVKSRLTTTRRVQMRLSAGERLAKEVKPAFIIVFDVNEARQFTGAWLLHVDGPLLELILTRLREAERDGAYAVNRRTFSFEPERYGRRIEVDGEVLRDGIEAAVAVELAAYVVAKRHKLETLGYDADRITLKTRLQFRNEDELIDAYLGLTEVEALEIRTLETRFGIELALPRALDMQNGMLSFQPTGEDNCDVVFRNGLATPPLSFSGEMLGPPGEIITSKNWKFRVITRFFELRLQPDSFKWLLRPEALKTPAPFAEIWALAMMLEISSYATSTIEVRHRTKGVLSGTSEGLPPDDPNIAKRRSIGRLFDKAKAILEKLGRPNHEISFDSVLADEGAIRLADAYLHDTTRLTPWRLPLKKAEGGAVAGEEMRRAMLTGALDLLGLQVAVAMLGHMAVDPSGDEEVWTSQTLETVGFQVLEDMAKDLPRFTEDVKRITGIRDQVMGLEPGDANG